MPMPRWAQGQPRSARGRQGSPHPQLLLIALIGAVLAGCGATAGAPQPSTSGGSAAGTVQPVTPSPTDAAEPSTAALSDSAAQARFLEIARDFNSGFGDYISSQPETATETLDPASCAALGQTIDRVVEALDSEGWPESAVGPVADVTAELAEQRLTFDGDNLLCIEHTEMAGGLLYSGLYSPSSALRTALGLPARDVYQEEFL